VYDLINVLSGKITFDCKAFQIADVASMFTKVGLKFCTQIPTHLLVIACISKNPRKTTTATFVAHV
jgi:hypothetical protein